MASTAALTGVTVQDQSDAATGGTQIGNLATTLERFVVPRFTSTAARDTAYANAVTAGATMADGMLCNAAGVPYRRIAGVWQIDRPRVISRIVSITGGAGSIISGGSAESGVTAGITLTGGNSFTLYEACTIAVAASFRAGPDSLNVGAALCYVKIDGATATNVAVSRSDSSVRCVGTVALTAGSHTVSLRVDANTGSCTWGDGIVTLTEGVAE